MSEVTSEVNILRNSELNGFRLQTTVQDIDNRQRVIEAPDGWTWVFSPQDPARKGLVPEVFHRSPGMEVSGGFMPWLGGFQQDSIAFKAGQRYLARGTTVQTYKMIPPYEFRAHINWRFVITPEGGSAIYSPWLLYGGDDWQNKGLEMLWVFEPKTAFTGSIRFECRCLWGNTDGGMLWINIACQEREADYGQATVQFIDPAPAPAPVPEPVPVPADGLVDLLAYMRGDGRIYDVAFTFPGNTFPSGIERMQTQVDGRRFFHVKGGVNAAAYNWEELWSDHEFIYRGTDISPNETELYQESENGTYGARWCPRFVRAGARFLAQPLTTFRNKSDGSNVAHKAPYIFPRWIEVKAIHPNYTFESGVKLNDVIELWGYLHDAPNNKPGANYERFWYARGFGLVAWMDPTKNPAWKSSIAFTQVTSGPLPRRVIPWLTLPPLPELPPQLPDSFPVGDPRWARVTITSTGLSTNIRAKPSTQAGIVGAVTRAAKPALVLRAEARILADGTWYPVRFSAGADVDFTLSGWVRSDVVILTDVIPAPDPVFALNVTYKNGGQINHLLDAVRALGRALEAAGATVSMS